MKKESKKNKDNGWRMITLQEVVKLELSRLKIHPKDSYQDVIKRLIKLDSKIKIEGSKQITSAETPNSQLNQKQEV